MTDADFLRLIAESPDDDLTRLAYADWLEETGAGDQLARAELIRVQCEAERLPEWDRGRGPLLRRAKVILKEHGQAWLAPLLKKGMPRKWTFRLGFVEQVETKPSAFPDDAEKLFEAAPMLRAARFPDASNEVDELLESPLVARLTEIDLSRMCVCGGCPIDEDQRLLFASPLIAGLRVLRLQGNRMDDETASALAGSPHLAGLRRLDLSRNRIGPAGFRALAASPHLAGLRELDLSRNSLSPGSVRALYEARWPALEVLRLNGGGMSGASLKSLAASPLLDSVRLLDLGNNPLSSTGAMALAKSRHVDRIESLRLDLSPTDRERLPRGSSPSFSDETTGALKARFGKKVRLR